MRRLQKIRFYLILTVIILIGMHYDMPAQSATIIKYPDLEKILLTSQSKTTIVNFWATWCGPCIKELPQFIALEEEYNSQDLELILVSFDFVEDFEKKLIPFVERKKIKSRVYLLDETDYNSIINKIHPDWSGAIPATLFIDRTSDNRQLIEGEFGKNALESTYLSFIK